MFDEENIKLQIAVSEPTADGALATVMVASVR